MVWSSCGLVIRILAANNDHNARKLLSNRIAILELIIDKQATEDLWYPDKGTLDDLIVPSSYYYNFIRMAKVWATIMPYDDDWFGKSRKTAP